MESSLVKEIFLFAVECLLWRTPLDPFPLFYFVGVLTTPASRSMMARPTVHTQLAMRVCGPDSIEVAAYARCLAQMSEDYSQFLSPGLPRPFYMPNPVPLYRQTLTILEKVIGPEDPSVSRVFHLWCPIIRHRVRLKLSAIRRECSLSFLS